MLNLKRIKAIFSQKKIALVTNCNKEPIHAFLKKTFRSYEVVFDKGIEQLGNIHSFRFFEIQLCQYGIHLSSTNEKNDLVIAVVTYSFKDVCDEAIKTLTVLMAKDGIIKKETHVIENLHEDTLRVTTLKILIRHYEEIKTPSL